MSKVACIDFETANAFTGSICAVGVAVVRDGALEQTYYSLVKPHRDYAEFNPFNVQVHGIRPKDVAQAPEFDAVYAEIAPLLEGAVLAAHNAPFDMSCLRRVLPLYGIEEPQASYFCTCTLSRKVWPALPNHRLNTVAASLNFCFRHHNALEDAKACATALLAAMAARCADSPEALLKGLGMNLGWLGAAPATQRKRRPVDTGLPF